MRVALGLDGLLCDLQAQQLKFKLQGDPYLQADEAFWATMPAHKDINDIKDIVWSGYPEKPNYIFLTERSKKLELITYSWLKRNWDPNIARKQIIYSTIKRYDCRLQDIQLHIDTEFKNRSWYVLDNIATLEWSRNAK